MVYSLAAASDGSGDLYVGGAFTTYDGAGANGLLRLNPDGSADAAFAVGTGFNTNVYALAPAADGTAGLFVGGAFDAYNGATASKLLRLNLDGTVDGAFTTGTGFNQAVQAIAPTGSGNIYIGGEFAVYQGIRVDYACLLTPDGTLQ